MQKFTVRVGVCLVRPPKVDADVFVIVMADGPVDAMLTATHMACVRDNIEMPIETEILSVG